MKKHLLPEGGSWYKANLHCHSTISDGKLTPEELKKVYTEKGYSIIAYTDHNVMLDHSNLNDENFLALVGYELDVSEPYRGRPAGYDKTCHFCAIAIDPKEAKQVCYHREKYCFGGKIAERRREPSRGGIGIRLKIASPRFTEWKTKRNKSPLEATVYQSSLSKRTPFKSA